MDKILLILFLSFNLFADQKTVNYLFNGELKTEAFVVLKDNKLVYSKFTQGDLSTRHHTWSMTKTITSLLFGIAQDKGFVSKEDQLCSILSCSFKNLKMSHLLRMTSGLDWKELYENDPFNSHVVRMLYLEMNKDVAKYILKTPQKFQAGTRFYYSSGDTNLINAVLKAKLYKSLAETYPWKFLFDPLEIKDAIFERDKKGVFVGSSYLYLSLESLIKIAIMISSDGEYKGKRIISKSYIDYMKSESEVFKTTCPPKEDKMTYGAQIWLNKPCKGKVPLESLSSSIYAMLGHGGQSIFFIPSKKLIAIRIANDSDNKHKLDFKTYLELLMEDF